MNGPISDLIQEVARVLQDRRTEDCIVGLVDWQHIVHTMEKAYDRGVRDERERIKASL